MAKEQTQGKQRVEVEVPEDMGAEQLQKLVGTFLKARDQGKKRDKAIQEATRALRRQYKAPYKVLLDAELKKVGLPVSK